MVPRLLQANTRSFLRDDVFFQTNERPTYLPLNIRLPSLQFLLLSSHLTQCNLNLNPILSIQFSVSLYNRRAGGVFVCLNLRSSFRTSNLLLYSIGWYGMGDVHRDNTARK